MCDSSPSSSFSKDIVTTKIPPICHGPFGKKGDLPGIVVGFSKYPGVRCAFEENFARRLELGAQLVVYEKGEKIIDLYGYAPGTKTKQGGKCGKIVDYDGDTLQCIFSSGKNMEAIAIAMLVDRGLIKYEDPVSKHWKEFGANGKDMITVADVMRHKGGVPFVTHPCWKWTIPIEPKDVFGVDPKEFEYQRDKDKMFIPLEAKICKGKRFPFSKSSKNMTYHAVTRGWLVNGIVRRVDGRSLAQFIREEITLPLSEVGDEGDRKVQFFCGISPTEQEKLKFADMSRPGIVSSLKLLLNEKTITETAKFGFRPNIFRYLRHVSWGFDYIDSTEGRQMECSSAHMFANARSIAKVNAAGMARDGSLDGVCLMSPDGVSNSMGDVVPQVDATLGINVSLSKGGYGDFKSFTGNDGTKRSKMLLSEDKKAYGNFMGWGGAGGSLSLVDRERDISFAYCMNAMHPNLVGGVRTRRILQALQDALPDSKSPAAPKCQCPRVEK